MLNMMNKFLLRLNHKLLPAMLIAMTAQVSIPQAYAKSKLVAESPENISLEQANWPREIQTNKGLIIIYQPQPEKLEGDKLEGRAAVAVEQTGKEPVFGAIWFKARLDIDREERIAHILDLSITRVRFPEDDKEKARALSDLLQKEVPKWQLPITMDELIATLELEQTRIKAAEKISVEPPKILFYDEPAVLISIDGEPRLQEVDDTKLMRVINTPYTILFETSSKNWFLFADKGSWYTASDIDGQWTVTNNVPKDVARQEPEESPEEKQAGENSAKDDESRSKQGQQEQQQPKIIVATEPTELISSTGKPEYTMIKGTDLMYVSNTDSDVLKLITTQENYVLLSGRWFSARKLTGPWKYVPGDQLPEDFSKISEDSEMGTVLYAVPGTEVAKEAVLDAQLPQTTVIDRKKASLEVEYDDKPKFESIKETSLTYAVNTATPVIKVDKKYYAVDDAVWFVANKPEGSWLIATSVPDEIYTIPPDSPMYHVTFVKIYGSTPEVVYIGYLPGYTGTYVYHSTIVYGTGYYWPGWYGHRYYPRPATWGFHVRWNPYRGWSFGLSYSTGPFTFTIGRGGWHRGGWWGPGRYRGYNRGYRHGRRAGYRSGYRAGRRQASRNNIYRNQRNNQRNSLQNKPGARASSGMAGKRAKATSASNRKNNVFSDKNGNIHRKTDKGWEQRSKGSWKSEGSKASRTSQKPAEKPSQKPSQKPTSTGRLDKSRSTGNISTQKRSTQNRVSSSTSTRSKQTSSTRQLDRSSSSRQRGTQRTQSFNRARSGGGSRGGRGGGRR